MADFALWMCACEGALWKPGTFMAAYDDNCASAVETVLEADAVATGSAFAHVEENQVGGHGDRSSVGA